MATLTFLIAILSNTNILIPMKLQYNPYEYGGKLPLVVAIQLFSTMFDCRTTFYEERNGVIRFDNEALACEPNESASFIEQCLNELFLKHLRRIYKRFRYAIADYFDEQKLFPKRKIFIAPV